MIKLQTANGKRQSKDKLQTASVRVRAVSLLFASCRLIAVCFLPFAV
jgi:hypothetical protein